MKRTKKFRRKGIILVSILAIVVIVFAVQAKFIKVTVQSDSSEITSEITNYSDLRTKNSDISLETIRNSSEKSALLFTANWCGSCSGLVNNLEEYAREFPDVKFYVFDLENYRDLALKLDIGLIPTLVLLDKNDTKLLPEVRIEEMGNTLYNFNKLGVR